MTRSDQPTVSNPTCKRCGRFLRSPAELALGYCSRCPPPAPGEPPDKEEIFCCGSDPPCWTCPFVARPDE